jgi:hypothetical protein
MPAVSATIQNLLNGVSSQAVALRLPTQGEEQINGYSALTRGLIKRPPTKLLKNLGTVSGIGSAFIHTINRDASEKYVVMIANGDLRVFDLAGNEKTVSFPHGKAYITYGVTDPSVDFSAVSVNDYTFIAQRNKTVAMSSTNKVAARVPEALVNVTAGNYDRVYQIRVNGVQAAYYRTPDGSNRSHYHAVDTSIITQHLNRALNVSGSWDPRAYYMNVASDYGNSWEYAGVSGSGMMPTSSTTWDTIVYGDSIHIKNIAGTDFTIESSDGANGSAMKTIKDKAQKFSDLPAKGPDGFTVEIAGDTSNDFDNYWVTFDSGSKTWTESMKPGTTKGFDPTTMPHVLIRNADGTFTFQRATWDDRVVGSDDRNPPPSFVGSTINSIFFHRNRLGFLSDDNIILSEAGEYFNFWPKTLMTVLDSDPIDVGSSYTEVTTFRHAIPFGGDLAVFSDQALFRLSGGDLLTPKSAALKPYGAFNMYQYCKPEAVGTVLLWSANRGENAAIREMWLDENGIAQTPNEASSHCPDYIPKNVTKITASSDLNLALFASPLDPSTVYAYKYYWSGQEKPQASWSKWTFPFTVLAMKFIGTDLYMVVQDGTDTMLLTMPCHVDYTETGQDFAIHLDKRVTVTGSYNSTTGNTTYTLPYTAPTSFEAWSSTGLSQVIVSKSGTSVVLQGNTTALTVIFGSPYQFLYRFSKLIMRTPHNGGGTTAVVDGRLQIIRMQVQYAKAAEFKVRVSSTNGNVRTLTQSASGMSLDDPLFLTEAVVLSYGTFSFPVKHENWTTEIELLNDSALPTDFISADWSALFHPGTKRV